MSFWLQEFFRGYFQLEKFFVGFPALKVFCVNFWFRDFFYEIFHTQKLLDPELFVGFLAPGIYFTRIYFTPLVGENIKRSKKQRTNHITSAGTKKRGPIFFTTNDIPPFS